METITEKEYMCKFCNKKFPSGKSLGGHIRIHTNEYSVHSSSYNAKNPKKRKRIVVEQREITTLKKQKQLCCRECGKGFDSSKDLWDHMDGCHCEGEKLVMDTETTSSGSSRKRSKKRSSSEYLSSCSSACEIDEEHKNTALSLMMMSMDSRGFTFVVNSLVAESSVNNSDDDYSGASLSDSCSSDSDYFMNGPKKSDDVSVDEFLRNSTVFNNCDELGVKEGSSRYELLKSKTVDLMVKKASGGAKKKSKGHECPNCFRVFKSGQALGGHKRSHFLGNHEHRIKHKAAADMCIDLNLPSQDIEE